MNNNGLATAQPEPDLIEITGRVQNYREVGTTNNLYDFGKMLLQEEVDRAHWIDSKAATLAGFSGAVVALMLSTSSSWKNVIGTEPQALKLAVIIGVGLVLLSGGLGFVALVNRTFKWIDEKNEWFAQEYLDFPDQLKRFYVLTMYQAARSHDKKNQIKSQFLTVAQVTLLLGGLFLAVPLMSILWKIVNS